MDAGGISASEAVRHERVVEQSHTETCHTGGQDRPSEPTSSGEVYHAASYKGQPCVWAASGLSAGEERWCRRGEADKEREEYELARTEGCTTISRYVAEGTVIRNCAEVLAILIRLRQFCCHHDLLGKTTTHTGVVAVTPAELRERLIELRLVLGSGSDECAVCLDSLPALHHIAEVLCTRAGVPSVQIPDQVQ